MDRDDRPSEPSKTVHLTVQNATAGAAGLSLLVFTPLYVYAQSFADRLGVSIEELGLTQFTVVLNAAVEMLIWISFATFVGTFLFIPVWFLFGAIARRLRRRIGAARRAGRHAGIVVFAFLLTAWVFTLPPSTGETRADTVPTYVVFATVSALALYLISGRGVRVLICSCLAMAWLNAIIAAIFLGGTSANSLLRSGEASGPHNVLGLVVEPVTATQVDGSEIPMMSEKLILLRQSGNSTLLLDLERRVVVRFPTEAIRLDSAQQLSPTR